MFSYLANSYPTTIGDNIKAFDWYKFDEDQTTRLDERSVIVNFSTWDYKCTCRLFDSSGWLCRHILKTMEAIKQWENLEARDIPERYFLDRWRKTARLRVDLGAEPVIGAEPESEVGRYHELCSLISVFALEASTLVSTYNVAKETIRDGRNRVRNIILELHGERGSAYPSSVQGVEPLPSPSSNNGGRPIPNGLKEKTNVNRSTKRNKSRQAAERERFAQRENAKVRRRLAKSSHPPQ
ncbi:Protein FAR1-RELATED SEQUENCE 3 [Linum perenne]